MAGSWRVLLLSLPLLLLSAAACPPGGDCDRDRFQCQSDPVLPLALDIFARPGRSLFSSPCRCLPDWKSQLCNQSVTDSSTKPSSASQHNLPTICICRKFGDAGNSCLQFITRCFRRKNDCGCCFNQPSSHCDLIKCSDGEPDFGGTNTTCQCHRSPADYPLHLCSERKNSASSISFVPTYYNDELSRATTSLATSHSVVNLHDDPHAPVFKVGDFGISPVMILIFLLALIALVLILTGALLVAGHCRSRRRRAKVKRERQLARDALIQQRAEEDRYLPTV